MIIYITESTYLIYHLRVLFSANCWIHAIQAMSLTHRPTTHEAWYYLCLQATVYLLEKLDVILSKASEDEIKSDVLPMIFSTLESNSIQGQVRGIIYGCNTEETCYKYKHRYQPDVCLIQAIVSFSCCEVKNRAYTIFSSLMMRLVPQPPPVVFRTRQSVCSARSRSTWTTKLCENWCYPRLKDSSTKQPMSG